MSDNKRANRNEYLLHQNDRPEPVVIPAKKVTGDKNDPKTWELI